MTDSNRPPRLGITVLGDFILSEGVEAVLENLQRVGATDVACNPTVTAAAEQGQGSFQPPPDAGESPRLFDRPLFGKHALWVRSAPSYRPNQQLYRDSPYRPRQVRDLTEQHGALIGRFIGAAAAAGMTVHLQLGAAQPSGLRDDDRPRLPTGDLPTGRMADTASLASAAVRAYNRAYVRDLLEAYPQVAGIRADWPESPCYTFGELFQDFSSHVADWSARHGFDFAQIRADVATLYDHLLHRLQSGEVRELAAADRGLFLLIRLLSRHESVAQWLRLKAALSVDLLRHWREAIDAAGRSDVQLCGHAFMPPYTLLTGFDFAGAAEVCSSISPKLYTMHWSLMVKFWAEAILADQPHLDEGDLVTALVPLMDLAEPGQGGTRLADYGYPRPDQPHPISTETQQRKLAQAKHAVGETTPLIPLVHGYGPADDFRRRLELVAESPADGVWINRYGYLSDEKLDTIASLGK